MPIHDHFDGSARCVECGGQCKLTGDARSLTELVRTILETRAFGKLAWLSEREKDILRSAGASPEALLKRARETT